MTYRPTSLRLGTDHCPRAIDFMEEGRVAQRDVFAQGTTAHAVLEAVGLHQVKTKAIASAEAVRTIAEAVVETYTTKGRVWSGVYEAPLPVLDVRAGAELARAWLAEHDLPVTGAIEHGLAFDADWRPMDYADPAARFRLIADRIDLVQRTDDWGGLVAAARVLDFKTAWSDGEERLDHIQQRAQALAVVRSGLMERYGAATVEIAIVNLRTGREWTRLIPVHELDELAAQWQDELDALMRQADIRDPDGRRPARPGRGCLGCPYLMACEAAQAHLQAQGVPETPEGMAVRYAVAKAVEADLGARLRLVAQEGPVIIPGGYVGFAGKVRREVTNAGASQLVEAWLGAGGEVQELIRLSGLSVTGADKVIRKLAPKDKAAREALAGAAFEAKTVPTFGLHADKEQEGADGSV